MHVIDGFGVLTFGATRFGAAEKDYVFAVALDKWGVGAVVLAYAHTLVSGAVLSRQFTWVAAGVPPALIAVGIFLQVPVDIKAGWNVLAFIGLNFFVCATEEGFYRLLVQERLHAVMTPVMAWLLSGLLFFVTHYSAQASAQTLMVFLLAGFCYATVYSLTRSLRATILAHWASNALHVILLRYPL
jgi:membrane protease YdiL (CAAX protease family)